MILQALLFLRVAAALGCFGAHGVSVGVALSLRGDASPERLRALLEVSDASRGVSSVGLMLLLASGVALGPSFRTLCGRAGAPASPTSPGNRASASLEG